MTTGFAVAIDGPGGVGKSTIARMVAERLGITYIDTGAMYRAVALYCTEKGVPLKDATAVEKLLGDINIGLRNENGLQRVYINDRDVTDDIRTQEMSAGASYVAAHPAVREKLVKLQQQLAATGRVIMDGRDIASQVLPWAQVKIYLDADIDIRTKRRLLDLEAKGLPADFATVRKETIDRDERDKNRPISPLVRTPDAVCIDSSYLTPDEITNTIISLIPQA